MQITMLPSEKDANIKAIQRAIDRKTSEVDAAQNKLAELQAELRGLQIAMKAINGESTSRS